MMTNPSMSVNKNTMTTATNEIKEDTMSNKPTSAMTSINKNHLPAIYKKIDWDTLRADFLSRAINTNNFSDFPLIVIDYGCGRYTTHINEFMKEKGFTWFGYDPYWEAKQHNAVVLSLAPAVVICSNVFNVIKDDNDLVEARNNISSLVEKGNGLYFYTVYEGDKSGFGRHTKKDCYQRNQPTNWYKKSPEQIRKNVVACNGFATRYIK